MSGTTKGRAPARGKTAIVAAGAVPDESAPMMTPVAEPPAPQSLEIADAFPASAILTSEVKETTMSIETNVTNIAADAASKTKTMIDQTTVQTRATMEKTMEQATKAAEGMMKAAEEAAEFGRGNIEAMTKAAQLWATGTQDLARQYAAVAQGFADHAMESAKALSSVKSLKEAADLQASFAKAAFEKSSSETTKFQEAVLRLTESASAPITARMQIAMEKLSKPIAA
ncbi:phasin family protein [Plastoroseomonas arctica]|nr:phasin family protein [Plastoroseomonas arctica]